MKILFIVSAFNGMSQRIWLELDRLNHQVKIHIATSEEKMCEAVKEYSPELVICPYLKKKIPASIYENYTCMIIHPGIVGDRGSSSLDWALLNKEKVWGVSILAASEKMDAGNVWAWREFPLREASKAAIYRNEVTQAATVAVLEAVRLFETASFDPVSPDLLDVPKGTYRRPTNSCDYHFDWSDPSDRILRKIRAADSSPGAEVKLFGLNFLAFGGHREELLKGVPGSILGKRSRAICIATGDGAIWLSHLQSLKLGGIKLPATIALGELSNSIPDMNISSFDPIPPETTFREIYYEEEDLVGYIYFNFYNGAMDAKQCRELRDVFLQACKKPTKVICLMGGEDLWSNGIHLNVIEASDDPAQSSWDNILAIDDLIESIIRCHTHYVISALQGNAGAGGVPFALAADKVIARKGIVLNPHTKNMGLYGSEFWTYLLPKRIGTERAKDFAEQCLPWGTSLAMEVRLIDECLNLSGRGFIEAVKEIARSVAKLSYFEKLLQGKVFKRNRDEAYMPLAKYREKELQRMKANFYEDDQGYDGRRYCFVHKKPMENLNENLEQKDLFSERRKIWRRRKYESLNYE